MPKNPNPSALTRDYIRIYIALAEEKIVWMRERDPCPAPQHAGREGVEGGEEKMRENARLAT